MDRSRVAVVGENFDVIPIIVKVFIRPDRAAGKGTVWSIDGMDRDRNIHA